MARYTISGRSTVVGTNLRGQFSLFAVANRIGKVRECGIFNTSATAFQAALARFTAAGTQGTGLTESKYDTQAPDAELTGFAGHTGDGSVGETVRTCSLGAAIGSGVIWTFGDTGIVIPAGTANGIGVIVPNGTGQITDFHLDWDE